MRLHDLPAGAVGPHGLSAPPNTKTRDQMMAEFRAETLARRQTEAAARRAKAPPPSPSKPSTDYPWLKPGWVEAPMRPKKQ